MKFKKIAVAALSLIFFGCLGAFGCGLFDDELPDGGDGNDAVIDDDGDGNANEEVLPSQDEPFVIENDSIFTSNFCVKVNKLALSYAKAEDCPGGNIDDSKLFYGNLKSGDIYYMVTDITAQKAGLTGDGGLKVEYEFSPNTAFSVTLQETSTGNFREYTEGETTRVEIVFGLPDNTEEFTRRAVFKVTPKLSGEPVAKLTFSGEGVDIGSKSEINAPVCVGNFSRGLSYSMRSDVYTVMGMGAFEGSDLVIPEIHDGNAVTAIYDRAFNTSDYTKKISLKTLTLSDSITKIGMHAFCFNAFTSVTIPKNVKDLGYQAFAGCSSLSEINFNAKRCNGFSGTDQGDVFSNCTSDMTINFGAEVELVPVNLFYNQSKYNTSLKAVNFTAGHMPAIGDYAFAYCRGITELRLPGVTNIYKNAFIGCTSLKTLVIEGNGGNILDGAFYGCDSLTSVTIKPTSVASVAIDTDAFAACRSLTTVTLSGNCYVSGERAFKDCTSLQSISIPAGFYIPKETFKNCTSLRSVTLGENLDKIRESAFEGCKALNNVVIPDNVTEIGPSAFYGCTSLGSVVIGKSVKLIDQNAFYNCPLSGISFKVNWGWYTDSGEVNFSNASTAASLLKSGNYTFTRI